MNKEIKRLKAKIKVLALCFIGSIISSEVFAVDNALAKSGYNFAVRIYNSTQYPVYYYYNSIYNSIYNLGEWLDGNSIGSFENLYDLDLKNSGPFSHNILAYVIPLNNKALIVIPNVTTTTKWDISGDYYVAEVPGDFSGKSNTIWDFIPKVASGIHMGTSHSSLDPNWHGCINFKQEGNDLQLYQTGLWHNLI